PVRHSRRYGNRKACEDRDKRETLRPPRDGALAPPGLDRRSQPGMVDEPVMETWRAARETPGRQQEEGRGRQKRQDDAKRAQRQARPADPLPDEPHDVPSPRGLR